MGLSIAFACRDGEGRAAGFYHGWIWLVHKPLKRPYFWAGYIS